MRNYFLIILLLIIISACSRKTGITSEKISSKLFSDTTVLEHMKIISGYINDRECFDNAIYDARGGGDPEYHERLRKDIDNLEKAVFKIDYSKSLKEIYSYCGDQIEIGNCNYWKIISHFLINIVEMPDQDAFQVVLQYPTKNALWYYGPYRSHGGEPFQAQGSRNIIDILWRICDPQYVNPLEREIYDLAKNREFDKTQERSRVLGDLEAKTLLERLRKDFESGKIKFKN